MTFLDGYFSRRASWQEYFMMIALVTAGRSDCLRRRIGCIAVSPQNRIVATGYNAPPAGELSYAQYCQANLRAPNPNCCKGDLPAGSSYDVCNAIHAEANCLLQLGSNPYEYIDLYLAGVDGNGNVLIDLEPCIYCSRLIKNFNVRRIYRLEADGRIGYILRDSLRTTVGGFNDPR